MSDIIDTTLITNLDEQLFNYDLQVCIERFQKNSLNVEVIYTTPVINSNGDTCILYTALLIGRLKDDK